MSVCISRHGEYSGHTIDTDYTCTLCGDLDETAMRVVLNRLRADRDGLRELADHAKTLLADATAERDRLAAEVADLRANPADDYHTMAELYQYRMLYNAHAVTGWVAAGIPVVKSWRHHDGELCFGGGWFIVTAQLPTGQVSNHYPASAWERFAAPEVETAPEWDGHTPADAADRLRAALDGECLLCGEPDDTTLAEVERTAVRLAGAEAPEPPRVDDRHVVWVAFQGLGNGIDDITREYAARLSPTEFIPHDNRDDAAAYVDRARAAGYDATLVRRTRIHTEWTEVQP